MRLNKKTKGGFVGQASCLAVLGLIAAGLIFPQIDKTYADAVTGAAVNDEENDSQQVTFSVNDVFVNGLNESESPDVTFTVNDAFVNGDTETKSETVEFEVDRLLIDGKTVSDERQVQFNVIGYDRDSKDIDVEFTVEEYLQITAADNAVSVDMGNVSGATASGKTTINAKAFTVTGNNSNGFEVYVYAPDSTALTGETAGNVATVESTQSVKTLANLDNNTWGYNILAGNVTPSTSTSLRPITDMSHAQHILASNTAASVNLKLACGAKVDSSLPDDTYGTNVVLAAVAPFTAGLVEGPAAE